MSWTTRRRRAAALSPHQRRRGGRSARAGALAVAGLALSCSAVAAGWFSPPAAATMRPVPVHRVLGVAHPRQLWVWSFDSPAELVDLAGSTQVTELLVWAGPGFSHDPATMARLRRLIVLAHRRHITVSALCGDPSWVLAPAVAGSWAREVAGTRLFTRIHLDVEPHALPDWSSNTERYGAGLLAVLDAVRGAGLRVSADIPYWYDTVRVDGARLDRQVERRVGSVTIMAFSRTTAGVLARAEAEVSSAPRAFIGVNIAPPGGDPISSTMLGLPAAVVFGQLRDIDAAAAGWRGYRGLAIHDSEYLAKLRGPALAGLDVSLPAVGGGRARSTPGLPRSSAR